MTNTNPGMSGYQQRFVDFSHKGAFTAQPDPHMLLPDSLELRKGPYRSEEGCVHCEGPYRSEGGCVRCEGPCRSEGGCVPRQGPCRSERECVHLERPYRSEGECVRSVGWMMGPHWPLPSSLTGQKCEQRSWWLRTPWKLPIPPGSFPTGPTMSFGAKSQAGRDSRFLGPGQGLQHRRFEMMQPVHC